MLLAHLLGQPIGERLLFKWIAEALRHTVGGVRIPQIQVQEPIVTGGVFVEPFERDGFAFVGVVDAAAARIVNFGKTRVNMPRAVTLAKRRNHRGVFETVLTQSARPTGAIESRLKRAVFAFEKRIRRDAAVIDDAVQDAGPTAKQRGARGQTRHIGRVTVVVAHAARGDSVDVGRGVAVITVTTQMIGPQRIDVEVKQAHKSGR